MAAQRGEEARGEEVSLDGLWRSLMWKQLSDTLKLLNERNQINNSPRMAMEEEQLWVKGWSNEINIGTVVYQITGIVERRDGFDLPDSADLPNVRMFQHCHWQTVLLA